MASLLYRLGHLSVRRRWWVLGIWVALLVTALVANVAGGGETSPKITIPGTESQAAADLLDERFPEQAGATVRVVLEAPPGQELSDPALLQPIQASIQPVLAVEGVVTTPDNAVVLVAPDKRIAFAEVRFAEDATEVPRESIEAVMEIVEDAVPDEVAVSFGGDAVDALEGGEPPASEAIGLIVAVIVLLVAFGSVIAMGLNLFTALLGVVFGLAGIGTAAAFIDISDIAPTLATMIGLAVGIDYALFIITRHRQFLHEGLAPAEAAARANATAGGAVVFAGMTVVIAIAGLAIVGIPAVTSMGFAAAATVLTAVAVAITLVPALLGFAGENIDRFTMPGTRPTTGEAADHSATFSGRFAHDVTSHPVIALLLGLVVIGVLTVPMFSMRLGIPDDGSDPLGSTQRTAYDTLVRGFGPGFNGPLLVVVEAADGAGGADLEGMVAELAGSIQGDPGVQAVSPPRVNSAGDTALFSVVPTTGPSDEATSDLVHRLRNDIIPPAAEDTGAEVSVGGTTAANIDISDKLARTLPVFMAFVIGLTVLLLLIVFRSVVVPIKAAIAILLSIGASFGVVVAVFQWGWLNQVVGLDSTLPIVSFLPMMMFAILFGLSMDYEVFILSRIREEYAQSGAPRASVLRGLTVSARVITAAALIMISVFAAFVLGDDPVIKMFGIGLATAVLLDATVVRMIVVPAVMTLFDRAAWWLPRWLDRLLPDLDVEGERLLHALEGPGDEHGQEPEDQTAEAVTSTTAPADDRRASIVN